MVRLWGGKIDPLVWWEQMCKMKRDGGSRL